MPAENFDVSFCMPFQIALILCFDVRYISYLFGYQTVADSPQGRSQLHSVEAAASTCGEEQEKEPTEEDDA